MPFDNPLVSASVLLMIVFASKTVLTLLREWFTARASARVHYDIKRGIMGRYAIAHYQYMLDNQQGSLLYNLLNATSSVPSLMTVGAQMATALFRVLTITILLLTILPFATLALIIVSLAYYTFTHILSKRVSFNIGVDITKAGTSQNIIVNEFLSGFRPIITLNAGKWWTAWKSGTLFGARCQGR
jgi:ABC-type multidrug transport system fused ATPase/permease subunit